MKAVLAALLVASTGGGCRGDAAPPVLPIGGDFTLIDQDGRRFESTSLRGNVSLLFFGYTYCPDVCPTTLSKLSAVSRALGDQHDRVRIVYITVDPERDTPAVLREHLSMFRVNATGLTGTPDDITRVVQEFGVHRAIETVPSEAGYFVAHTTSLFVLDTQGHVRLLLPYEATVDEVVAGVRSVMEHPSAQTAAEHAHSPGGLCCVGDQAGAGGKR